MKNKLLLLSLLFIIYSNNTFSQVNIEEENRAEFGAIIAVTGHKPISLISYNNDFNLVQTNIAPEGGAFYKKYLSEIFDLQIEIVTGYRYLNMTDSFFNYRITDLYYALNILPVFKFRDDTDSGKNVQFNIMGGPSINFLTKRTFSFPQSLQPLYNNLNPGEVITLAYVGDFGIKYHFSLDNSFLMGVRGSRDLIFLHRNQKDHLKVRYWNYGVYVGFAGKIRKK